MKLMTVGMMILVAMMGVEMAHAQDCTLIYTLVQLTDQCDGGNPLPDGTLVCLYWDQDNDGPDVTDPIPDFATFSCFGMNGLDYLGLEGTFYTDPALCFIDFTPVPNRFYFRVHIGGAENLCWTSEVFTDPGGFGEVELVNWACAPCPLTQLPGPITGLTASHDQCGQIEVSWDVAPLATSYRIFVDGALMATIPSTQFFHNGLPPGSNCHLYQVQAQNAEGLGPISNAVQGCALIPPPAVTGLQASHDLCNEIRITWSINFEAEYYEISRDGFPLETVSGSTSYTDFTAVPGIFYQYSVRAGNACGLGVASTLVEGHAADVLPAPTSISASSNYADRVDITWMDISGETGYEIFRSEFNHTPEFLLIATPLADMVNYSDYNAESGHEYLYKVRGFDAECGVGPLSPTARGRRTTAEPVIFGEFRVTNNLAGVMSAEAADLDEDGDLDVVAAGMFADKVAWYENDGQWNFTEHVLLDRWQGARAVGVSDLDSDGDLDIAAVATFENALIWLEQHPDGFWFHHISSEVMGPTDILVGRTLGGLHSEIITAAGASGEISRWFYNGDAPFERQVFATNMPGARSLDFGRGALPSGVWLTAAAAGSGELVWWQSFNGYQRVSLGFHPGVVACGGALMDVETDSLIDVFFCTDDGFLGWYDREFGSVHEITSILDEPRDVTSGLMDRDDRQDLVVASGHEITWWRNTSNRFYRNVVTDNLPQASFVNTLDADGDGDMDILAAGDNEIRFYLSTLRDLDNTTQLVPAPEDEHDGQAFGLPTEYALEQNYPNPFNAQTTIRFALPEAGAVHLSIYDLTGREAAQLVNGTLNAGTHTINFDAAGLASGVYFYRLEAAGYTETRKMVLMK